jgi:hypothetical protein
LPFTQPAARFSFRFTAGQVGSLKAFAETNSADNIGPLVDNFRVESLGVPEPATWAMMILGFGVVGGALRRRRQGSVASAAA